MTFLLKDILSFFFAGMCNCVPMESNLNFSFIRDDMHVYKKVYLLKILLEFKNTFYMLPHVASSTLAVLNNNNNCYSSHRAFCPSGFSSIFRLAEKQACARAYLVHIRFMAHVYYTHALRIFGMQHLMCAACWLAKARILLL